MLVRCLVSADSIAPVFSRVVRHMSIVFIFALAVIGWPVSVPVIFRPAVIHYVGIVYTKC